VPQQAGNNHPTNIPTGVFQTADGAINISAAGQNMFERLARAMDGEELLAHPDFATAALRSQHRDKLNVELERHLLTAPAATWIERLNAAGVPCGIINSIDQVFEDPQVRHLNMVAEVDSPHFHPLRLVAQAMTLSRTPSEIRRRPPECGEHTDEILKGLGYHVAQITDLRDRGVV
jgi:formyl-CoA transferase